MGVKVSTPYERAGVECPKRTGEMDMSLSCKNCPSWPRCMNSILGALGVEG